MQTILVRFLCGLGMASVTLWEECRLSKAECWSIYLYLGRTK